MSEKERIIKGIIRGNYNIESQLSINSTDEEVLQFLYRNIEINYVNFLFFVSYIEYMIEKNCDVELASEYLDKVLKIGDCSRKILHKSKDELKKIFFSEKNIKTLCNSLINYYDEEVHSFQSTFYSYEICIENLCTYYNIFNKLFEYEKHFLDVLKYAISWAGESSDIGYSYKGLETIRPANNSQVNF